MEFDLIWDGTKYHGVWNDSIKAFALRPVAPPAQKRCIIRIVRNHSSREMFTARINAFHHALENAFSLGIQNSPGMNLVRLFYLENNLAPEYCYTILGARQKHMEWAQHAKACGLIDAYQEDYDPNIDYSEEE